MRLPLNSLQLPTLRKVNKLWPSDPVQLRTHLYVPLEACRWSRATQTVIHGPIDGQITLEQQREDPSDEHRRTMDVVRIPASQLRFFPKPRKPPDSVKDTLHTISPKHSSTSIHNDLKTLPAPLRPPARQTVKLRLSNPPTMPKSKSKPDLTDRLVDLFDIPPPNLEPPLKPAPAIPKHEGPAVVLELHQRRAYTPNRKSQKID